MFSRTQLLSLAMTWVSCSLSLAPSAAASNGGAKTLTRSVASKSNSISKPLSLQAITPHVDLTNEPDPTDILSRAVREYSAGNLPKAEMLFEKVVFLDPANADAHFNLAAIKEWKNDWPAALAEYKAAQKVKPDDKEIAEAIRAVEFKIKNKPAIEAQMQKQRRETELATHTKMAKECFGAQDYEQAAIHLGYLAQVNPDDPKVQFALGQSFRALHKYDWAAYRLKMAIFLDADNDVYRKTLVDLDKEVQRGSVEAYNENTDRGAARTEKVTTKTVTTNRVSTINVTATNSVSTNGDR